jgi:hypothetical protein
MSDSEPTVSACLIVRDEQRQLPLCLASLAPWVTEIVVCDTGSADATVAVAGLGWEPARTVQMQAPWTDHFAAARNAALARCQGDWVLSIDADEVALADPAALSALLAATSSSVTAFAVEIANAPGPDRNGLQTHSEHKLFRRTAVHWTGRVHERIETVDGSPLSSLALPSELLRLRHDGYRDSATVTAKALRNARLCELELAELRAADPLPNPERLAAVTLDLGRSYLGAGRPRAAQAAFATVRRTTEFGPTWRWATDFLARLALDERRPNDVLALAHELSGAGGPTGYCDWLRAQALALRGDLAHAELILAGLPSLVDVGGNQLELAAVRRLQAHVAQQLSAVG